MCIYIYIYIHTHTHIHTYIECLILNVKEVQYCLTYILHMFTILHFHAQVHAHANLILHKVNGHLAAAGMSSHLLGIYTMSVLPVPAWAFGFIYIYIYIYTCSFLSLLFFFLFFLKNIRICIYCSTDTFV
jgi:hypothetical protein